MVAKRFESDFNLNWAGMFSRNYIVSTVNASSDDEVLESRRQWNGDPLGRGGVGFASMVYWHVKRKIEDQLQGIEIPFNASRADDIVDMTINNIVNTGLLQ